jgi:hypothetical protein
LGGAEFGFGTHSKVCLESKSGRLIEGVAPGDQLLEEILTTFQVMVGGRGGPAMFDALSMVVVQPDYQVKKALKEIRILNE